MKRGFPGGACWTVRRSIATTVVGAPVAHCEVAVRPPAYTPASVSLIKVKRVICCVTLMPSTLYVIVPWEGEVKLRLTVPTVKVARFAGLHGTAKEVPWLRASTPLQLVFEPFTGVMSEA